MTYRAILVHAYLKAIPVKFWKENFEKIKLEFLQNIDLEQYLRVNEKDTAEKYCGSGGVGGSGGSDDRTNVVSKQDGNSGRRRERLGGNGGKKGKFEFVAVDDDGCDDGEKNNESQENGKDNEEDDDDNDNNKKDIGDRGREKDREEKEDDKDSGNDDEDDNNGDGGRGDEKSGEKQAGEKYNEEQASGGGDNGGGDSGKKANELPILGLDGSAFSATEQAILGAEGGGCCTDEVWLLNAEKILYSFCGVANDFLSKPNKLCLLFKDGIPRFVRCIINEVPLDFDFDKPPETELYFYDEDLDSTDNTGLAFNGDGGDDYDDDKDKLIYLMFAAFGLTYEGSMFGGPRKNAKIEKINFYIKIDCLKHFETRHLSAQCNEIHTIFERFISVIIRSSFSQYSEEHSMALIQKRFIINGGDPLECFIYAVRYEESDREEFWFKVSGEITRWLGFENTTRQQIQNNVRKEWQILWKDMEVVVDDVVLDECSSWPSNCIFIAEPALYALIAYSKKPEAVQFTKWIYEEALPAIRKQLRRGLFSEYSENIKGQLRDAIDALTCSQKGGYVYWATTESLLRENIFKIGCTSNLKSRLAQLNDSCAKEDFYYVQIFSCEDKFKYEKIAHDYCQQYKIKGDFFQLPHPHLMQECQDRLYMVD